MKKLLLALILCLTPITTVHAQESDFVFDISSDAKGNENIAPGDTFTYTYTVKNTTNEDAEVRLKEVVCKDSLNCDSSSLQTEWKAIPSGKSVDYQIDVLFPAEAKNEYQGKELHALAVFEARSDADVTVDTGKDTATIKTGDSNDIVGISILLLSAGTVMALVLWKRRNQE